jgi:hypothetical protein
MEQQGLRHLFDNEYQPHAAIKSTGGDPLRFQARFLLLPSSGIAASVLIGKHYPYTCYLAMQVALCCAMDLRRRARCVCTFCAVLTIPLHAGVMAAASGCYAQLVYFAQSCTNRGCHNRFRHACRLRWLTSWSTTLRSLRERRPQRRM